MFGVGGGTVCISYEKVQNLLNYGKIQNQKHILRSWDQTSLLFYVNEMLQLSVC